PGQKDIFGKSICVGWRGALNMWGLAPRAAAAFFNQFRQPDIGATPPLSLEKKGLVRRIGTKSLP
ncbi:MAG: hypothetical protein AAF191_15055, partial [Verrucomicrobiota bacterium]